MSANAHLTRRRSPWTWLPTLYVAEALPYVLVNTLTVYLYTKMGIGKAEMTFYTGWLYLPWVIKPFWSPFVDILSTKRAWTLAMQVLMGVCFAAIAFLIPASFFFAATLAFFWLAAFFSATHDIAADGYYMLELSDHDQAAYVGVRSTFYRLGSLLASGGLVWIAGLIELHGLPEGTEHVPHERVVVAWSTIFFIAGALLLIAVLKGLLSALCINLGWRGGNIFPIIYMGAAAGYACAQAVNLLGGDAALDGGFAVALVLAAMYGFLSQKPVTVIAVLLLCFPVTYILPIAVAAFVSAKVSQWFSRWRSREA